MTDPVTIVAVAFVAQLAVLPGEKVQLLVSGLATRYRPAIIVTAAGVAFAGWTAIEIQVGAALRGALAPTILDAVSALLFGLFAVTLLHSEPGGAGGQLQITDGGAIELGGRSLPGSELLAEINDDLASALSIFSLLAVGEFGDKTQLVTIALAVQYGAHPGIWVGEMAAIVPITAANAYCCHRLSGKLNRRLAHRVAAGLFAFFAIDTGQAILTGVSIWETVVEWVATAGLAVI